MKIFREYHDTYLAGDTVQLADVFENFRKLCMDNYGLDPAQYFTVPGMIWDALFKIRKHKQELLNDLDMHLMFERGTRGGVSQISTRYARVSRLNSEERFCKILNVMIYLKHITTFSSPKKRGRIDSSKVYHL